MPLPDHVLTTSAKSFGKKGRPWLKWLNMGTPFEVGVWYVFTDGSSLGSYAAVLVAPDGAMSKHAHWAPPSKTRNICAEWNGLLLGLRSAPAGVRLAVVVDLLWVHAQLIGVRRTLEPETQAQLAEAKRLIDEKGLDLVLIHHEGHQKDPTSYTQWNVEADRLCTEKAADVISNTPCVGDVVLVVSDGEWKRAEVTKVSQDTFLAKLGDRPDGAWRLSHHGALWRLAERKSFTPKKPKKSTGAASASSRSNVKKAVTKAATKRNA